MRLLRAAALIFLPLAAVAAGILYVLYRVQTDAYWEQARTRERHTVDLAAHSYRDDLAGIVSDLGYLSNQPQLRQWLADRTDSRYRRLVADYRAFSLHKGIYDQIRFIGANGAEKIRVDWDKGHPQAVLRKNLQDKSRRYYFTNTIKLPVGRIYVSPLDLNVENGTVEKPLKPMIRFATTVVDPGGTLQGVVVLNYLAQRLIKKLATEAGRARRFWIVNSAGYWLRGPHSEYDWGFMSPRQSRPKFSGIYRDVWTRAKALGSGQLTSGDRLWTFETVGGSTRIDGAAVSLPKLMLIRALPVDSGPYTRDYALGLVVLLVLLALTSLFAARHKTLRQAAEAEVIELNGKLERENGQLEALNKELEGFSYSISHDLRAPARAISGFCSLLVKDEGADLGAEGKRKLGVVRSEAERMSALIDDLLRFFRTGRGALEIRDIDMTALAKNVFERLPQEQAAETTDFRLSPLPRAKGDAALMGQVWTNLLSNAVKFSSKEPQPVVEVTGTAGVGENTYSVRDNGAGFDPKYAAKLFEVFQRLHHDSEFPGTGVGLALVQKIITRHGGKIWAESKPGEGAAFHFTLPA